MNSMHKPLLFEPIIKEDDKLPDGGKLDKK